MKGTSNFNERQTRPYPAEDIRFTTKGETLYASVLAWPKNGKVVIKTLAAGATIFAREVARIELLGSEAPVTFSRDANGLWVNMPEMKPNDFAYVLKITPRV